MIYRHYNGDICYTIGGKIHCYINFSMKVYFFGGRPISQNHLICVDLRLRLIPVSRALKLILCHVVCDTWWLCELSRRKKNKCKCVYNVILISRMPSIRCVSVEGPYAYVTFYVNWMVFFFYLNGYVHVRSMQVRWHVHPFIRGSI